MYVTHKREDGTYQPLKEHLENVAALQRHLRRAFTRLWRAGETDCCMTLASTATGDRRVSATRSTGSGGSYPARAHRRRKIRGCTRAFAIAGHHGGVARLRQGDGTMSARLQKRLDGGRSCGMEDGNSVPKRRITCLGAEGAVAGAMYTRMLFSLSGGRGFSGHRDGYCRGPQPRGGYADVETLLQRLKEHVAGWLESPRNEAVPT